MWPPSGKVPKIAKKCARGLKRIRKHLTPAPPSPRFPTPEPTSAPSYPRTSTITTLSSPCTYRACQSYMLFTCYKCNTCTNNMPTCTRQARSPTPATTSAIPHATSTHQQGNRGTQALELLLPQVTQPHAMPQSLTVIDFQRFRLDYN